MLKSAAELKKLPPDSPDVFITGALERYVNRPAVMEDVCYADFIALYQFRGKSKRGRRSAQNNSDAEQDEFHQIEDEADDEENVDESPMTLRMNQISLENGTLTQRKQAKVIRFCRFDIHKDPANFFRERIMLFKPWRDETTEVENVSHEQIYNDNIENITANSKRYIALDIDIESILHDINQQREEDDADTATAENEVDPNFVNVYDYDENNLQANVLFDTGYDQSSSVEAKKYNVPDMISDKDYLDLCDSLNEKQRDYLMHILNCFETNEVPVYHFISGGAGVGKSRLIKAVYQTLIRLFRRGSGDAGSIEIMIVAYTGKAAHNVGGMTAHHAFSLPMVDRSSSETFKGLGPEALNSCRVKLAKLKLIIIDEISMMGTSMFDKIHLRMNQIVGNRDPNKIFGGVSMLVLGDFNQLQPVFDDFVFMPSRKNVLNQIAGTPLWDKFRLFVLTEIMRQRGDREFAEALNRLAEGALTEADIEMFQNRCFNETSLPPEGQTALRLIFTNIEVNKYNIRKVTDIHLRNSDLIYAVSKAKDVVTGASNNTERQQAWHNLKDLPSNKTQGLAETLTLQKSARYVVTSNISVQDGLCNGTTGILQYIIFDRNHAPTTVFLQLDDPDYGKEARKSWRNVMLQHTDLKDYVDNWTPISRVKLSFTTTRKQHVKVNILE